jgi:hypothetical protein
MRKLLCIAGVTILGFIACNYDEGECWIDGQEAGGVGAGGPILPPGTGGFGDVPPEPQDAADPPVDCNPDDDGATELGELTCAPSEWGGNCTGRCLAYGAVCFPGVENQITKRQNLLWKCCNCNPGKCWYIDPTDPKSGCLSPTGAGTSLLCW